MKSNKIKILYVVFAIFLLTSCEDYLTIIPKGELTVESTFATEEGADLVLNDVYVGLPNPETTVGNRSGGWPGGAYDNWDFLSPFNFSKWAWAISSRNCQDYTYTASMRNPGIYNHDYPSLNFQYDRVTPIIRRTNLFIESVEANRSNYSDEWANTRLAEAKVLRAYYYHLLWMNYGGVPLITEVLNQKTMGDEIFKPSASMEEMFTFMQNELEDAANVLPNEVSNVGRCTKGTALTIKAWIELYWADIVKDPRPSTLFPADAQKAMTIYAQCAKTCKDIMELGTYGLMPTRFDAFTEANNNCKEHMFAFQQESTTRPSVRSSRFGPENPNTGNQGNVGHGSPTQALVDMYGMANGLPIDDPNSGYDPDQPYKGREPRFYQDVVCDSTLFAGSLFTFQPNVAAGDVQLLPNGNLHSGYYRRKGINESLNSLTFGEEAANFIFFRYADVLLMYAEARIKGAKLGGDPIDQDVIDALDEVRMRPATENDSGLPSLSATYSGMPTLEQLEKIIWTERCVELSFEYKAYMDVKRWRKAEELLTTPQQGIKWNASANKYENFKLLNAAWGGDKYYLMPIYDGWLESNPVWMDPANQVDGRTAGQNPGF